jgi:hypothetical protein
MSRFAQQDGARPFVHTPGLHVPVPGKAQSSFVAHGPVSPEVHWPVVVLQTPGWRQSLWESHVSPTLRKLPTAHFAP